MSDASPTATARRPHEIFSMIDGVPCRNLLGLGDPDVCRIDGRWHMFMGGFHTGFKNNLFCATLGESEPLSLDARWTVRNEPGHSGRAQSLVPQPEKGAWDHYGLHEPCFVAAPNGTRRVYYTGRASAKTTGTEGRFAIGFLEWQGGAWRRHGGPVMHGRGDAPSALGPKVIHADGLWRMWFRMVPHEPAKGVAPRSQLFMPKAAMASIGPNRYPSPPPRPSCAMPSSRVWATPTAW